MPRPADDCYPREDPPPPHRGRVPFAPEPVQLRTVRRVVAGEVSRITGLYRLWDMRQGRRCRLCPRELCTLSEAAGTGFGTCVVVVEPAASPDVEPTLALFD